LPAGPHFITICVGPRSPKGKPSCGQLSRLSCAGVPSFAQAQINGFRRRPDRQHAVAMLSLRSALPLPPHSGFQQAFRALRHLRKSGSQAHRSRTCDRIFRLFQTSPRHARLPLHSLPSQVLLYSSPQQRSPRRPAPYRELTPLISQVLEGRSPRVLPQRQFLLRQVIIRRYASRQLRVEAVTQTT
jgi:hypothetical protein